MKEYIEREHAMDLIKFYLRLDEIGEDECKYSDWQIKVRDDILDVIKIVAPTADVEEVRHGYWYLLDECANAGVYCSVCHKKVYKKDYANVKLKSKFCPNCGAKMDGGKK